MPGFSCLGLCVSHGLRLAKGVGPSLLGLRLPLLLAGLRLAAGLCRLICCCTSLTCRPASSKCCSECCRLIVCKS